MLRTWETLALVIPSSRAEVAWFGWVPARSSRSHWTASRRGWGLRGRREGRVALPAAIARGAAFASCEKVLSTDQIGEPGRT